MAITPEDEARVSAILEQLDLSGWAVLVNGVTPLLGEVMRAGGSAALATLKIPAADELDLTNVVNADAAAFAAARGAELVGMRYDEAGALVANPDASWAITDSTRELLRGTVRQAIEEGWSAQQLGAAVESSYAFSATRAAMIGRTEIARASEQGTLSGWRNSGVVDAVRWVLGSEHDDDVPGGDECDDNAEAGAIAIGEAFPSGDEAPPAHPNCICALEAVVSQEGDEQ
ncbi:MAG TPA: hypothetical protein VKS22_16275 [Candidatus Binataceae bacterium]|nr:hypothetical protein [Candidatus Binataceae bacterium]